jgi:hypothetical protein
MFAASSGSSSTVHQQQQRRRKQRPGSSSSSSSSGGRDSRNYPPYDSKRPRQQKQHQQRQSEGGNQHHDRFTIHKILPPLEPMPTSSFSSKSTTSFTTDGGKGRNSLVVEASVPVSIGGVVAPTPLSVVYTNDPLSARQWLDQHIFNKNDVSCNPNGADGGKEDDAVVVVGFDMESSPNLPWRNNNKEKKDDYYTGPATIQLAVQNDHALIIQIAQQSNGVGPNYDMIQIIDDLLSGCWCDGGNGNSDHSLPSILLVGVGIDQDLIELYRWYEEYSLFRDTSTDTTDTTTTIQERRQHIVGGSLARIDLGGIGSETTTSTMTTTTATTAGNGIGKTSTTIPGTTITNNNNNNNSSNTRVGMGRTVGMKRLAECILQQELPKSKKVSRSEWATTPLTNIQIAYAARDAWVPAAVIHQLMVLENSKPTTATTSIIDNDSDNIKNDNAREGLRFTPTELLKTFLRREKNIGAMYDDATTTPNAQDDDDKDKTNISKTARNGSIPTAITTVINTIAELSERARLRQQVRQHYKALKEKDGIWSNEDRVVAMTLEKELFRLAPPSPPMYETEQSLCVKV